MNGIQKYLPGQRGLWSSGSHAWEINDYGWPGPAPSSTDHLVTLIGDSLIENFMNPPSCQQAALLSEKLKHRSFLQVARSGATLIEYMEFAREMEALYSPDIQLVFVKDSDLAESLVSKGRERYVTQVDLKRRAVIPGTLKAPGLKKALYSCKVAYLLYIEWSKYLNARSRRSRGMADGEKIQDDSTSLTREETTQLFAFIKNNYETDRLVFVLPPRTRSHTRRSLRDGGIEVLQLSDQGKDWAWVKGDDSHWNRVGHEAASDQIVSYLKTLPSKKP